MPLSLPLLRLLFLLLQFVPSGLMKVKEQTRSWLVVYQLGKQEGKITWSIHTSSESQFVSGSRRHGLVCTSLYSTSLVWPPSVAAAAEAACSPGAAATCDGGDLRGSWWRRPAKESAAAATWEGIDGGDRQGKKGVGLGGELPAPQMRLLPAPQTRRR
jgi:hypothetical protein